MENGKNDTTILETLIVGYIVLIVCIVGGSIFSKVDEKSQAIPKIENINTTTKFIVTETKQLNEIDRSYYYIKGFYTLNKIKKDTTLEIDRDQFVNCTMGDTVQISIKTNGFIQFLRK